MQKKNILVRVTVFFLSLTIFLQIGQIDVSAADYWPEGPAVESPNVILMEMSTGTVLYEKNSM